MVLNGMACFELGERHARNSVRGKARDRRTNREDVHSSL